MKKRKKTLVQRIIAKYLRQLEKSQDPVQFVGEKQNFKDK